LQKHWKNQNKNSGSNFEQKKHTNIKLKKNVFKNIKMNETTMREVQLAQNKLTGLHPRGADSSEPKFL
jgi:uncharacterized protein YjbI with pentapeptide repeats